MMAIILAVCASLCWGVGTNMQKHGMATGFPKIPLADAFRKFVPIFLALLANWVWLLGTALMLAGSGLFTTALAKGDIGLVQPIVNLTGVVALGIGVGFAGERVTRRELGGIALIVGGILVVGWFAGEPSAAMPSAGGVVVFAGATVLLTVAMLALRRLRLSDEYTLSLAAGACFGLSNLVGKLLTQRAVLHAGMEFSLGAWPIWRALLTDYPFYIASVATIFGTVFMQTAFAHGRASVVSPITTIVSNILPIVAALTIFGEHMTAPQGLGIAVVLVGTASMASLSPPPEPVPA